MTATEIDFDALDDGIIMVPAFESIKSCDDDDDDSFSRTLILKFFSQANDVVPELADLLRKRDLTNLSKRAHYLKGSAAVVGIRKVRESCETIQNQAARELPDKSTPVPEDEAAKACEKLIKAIPGQLEEAKKYLYGLYDMPLDTPPPPED